MELGQMATHRCPSWGATLGRWVMTRMEWRECLALEGQVSIPHLVNNQDLIISIAMVTFQLGATLLEPCLEKPTTMTTTVPVR